MKRARKGNGKLDLHGYYNSKGTPAPHAPALPTNQKLDRIMETDYGSIMGTALTSVLAAGWLRFLPLVDFFLRSSVLAGAAPGLSVLGGSGAFFSGSSRVGAGGSSSSGGSGSGSR